MPINTLPLTLLDRTAALVTGVNGDADFAGGGATFATYPRLAGDLGAGAAVRGLGDGSERTSAGKRCLLNIGRQDAAGGAVAGAFSVYGCDLPDPYSGKPLGNAFATQQSETVRVFSLSSAVAVAGSTTLDASGLSTDAINADGKGYNWLVVLNGRILPWAAAALATAGASWSISSGVVTLRAPAAVLSVGTTSGSTTVTAASTSGIQPGQPITGTGIPSGATIVRIIATDTSFEISLAATATGTINATIDAIPAGSDVVVYKLAATDVTTLLSSGDHVYEMVGIRTRAVMWTYWTTNQGAADRTVASIIATVGS